MKKILIIVLTLFINVSLLPQAVPALTATPAPTISKDDKLIDEINNLREKVASKVAELNLVEKRGIIITVQDVSGSKLNGTDLQGNTRLIDVDELTKFSSPSAKSTFGISDITKDSKISVIGLYNKQSKRILARFIDSVSLPAFISGQISEIDKVNFTITIVTANKSSILADIENITRTSAYTKEEGLKKLGFSKLQVNDRVYVSGFPNNKEKNRITASRIVVMTELPRNPKIEVPQASSDSFQKGTATPELKITPQD